MTEHLFELVWLKGRYAICRLDPQDEVPEWAGGGFVSATRTKEELSIVCAAAGVPDGVTSEAPFSLLRVRGSMELTLTGVLAGVVAPLAEAEIPVFAVATFDTDYLLVREEDAAAAEVALVAAGYRFVDLPANEVWS